MNANTTIFIENFHPKLTYNNKNATSSSLKIKASVADQISVVAVMIDHLPVKDNQSFQGPLYNGGGTGGQMTRPGA